MATTDQSGLQRKIIKTLLTKAINAGNRKAAFSSFRQDWRTGYMARNLTNDELSCVLEGVLEIHPLLRGKLGNDYGLGLMYVDSQITDHVLTDATRFKPAVLGLMTASSWTAGVSGS